MGDRRISTVEMHTGGEPVRIVTGGWPAVEGGSILAKRRFVTAHHDHLRRFLMHEPRGHADMYGVLPVAPSLPGADMAVLFMHNAGWSTMCGHATIALGRFALDRGIVQARDGKARLGLECPCGLVTVELDCRSGHVRFVSVPAFAWALDRVLEVPALGPVMVDIGYGGAFYAITRADAFGLDVRTSPVRALVEVAAAITEAGRAQLALDHPDDPDLAFLYGTILTDGGEGEGRASANVCVFAEREVDRSPTGSGVTARMALLHRRRRVRAREPRFFASITGAVFTGEIVEETSAGARPAVRVEVGGRAHYTGEAVFTAEDDDPLKDGFLVV